MNALSGIAPSGSAHSGSAPGNALVLQAGGPTAVINATLAAVIATWEQAQGRPGGRLLGARNGMLGLAAGDWVALDDLSPDRVQALAQQPGAALGGGRHRLGDEQLAPTLDLLARHEIGALFLIGGNGTAAAAWRLAQANPTLTVIALPKTVDNDLPGTEVAPGWGSAARYTAHSLRDAWLDLHAMSTFDDVVVYEVMGRHAGWLAAAACLARAGAQGGPQLILLPEAPIDEDALLEAIARVHARDGVCLVAAAEGVRDHSGGYLAERAGAAGTDASGQRVFSMAAGVSAYLCAQVQQRLGLRTRQVRANTLQRVAAALVSPLDRELAWMVGAVGVQRALEGESALLMGLARSGEQWRVQPAPLSDVVGRERLFPQAWLADPYDVAPAFRAYAAPFVEDLEPAPILW